MGRLSGTAMEHVKETPVSVVENAFTIEVPAGEVRIIGVDHVHVASGPHRTLRV